jgi:hypothetical protein
VTKTPLARLQHKEKGLDYLQCIINDKMLRESASDCDINLKTSFRWLHRFIQLPATMKATLLEGIVEADETLFAHSEKGNRTLERKPRRRGMKAIKRARSKEDKVPVLKVRNRGIDNLIVQLRKVLEAELFSPTIIKTVRNQRLCNY